MEGNAQVTALKIVKQSLLDWSVEQDGRVVAWISRDNQGYALKFRNPEWMSERFGEPYWFRYFAEAKTFAKEHA